MNKERTLLYFTGVLLTVIGVGGVVCGWMLMREPSGESIGLSLELIQDSPFKDYFIPGLVLFAINGLGSLLGAWLLVNKNRFAGAVTMLLGLEMIIWISAEFYWVNEESFLQPTMFAVGLLELLLGLLVSRQQPKKQRKIRHPLNSRSPRGKNI